MPQPRRTFPGRRKPLRIKANHGFAILPALEKIPPEGSHPAILALTGRKLPRRRAPDRDRIFAPAQSQFHTIRNANPAEESSQARRVFADTRMARKQSVSLNMPERLGKLLDSLGMEIITAQAGSTQGQFPILDLLGNLRDETAGKPDLAGLHGGCAEVEPLPGHILTRLVAERAGPVVQGMGVPWFLPLA